MVKRNTIGNTAEEINLDFLQMMEALGYDIEITYVKRKTDGE